MQNQTRWATGGLLVALIMMLFWALPVAASHHEAAAEAPTKYICGCGGANDCTITSDQPGQGPCGKPLMERKVLKQDDQNIYVCACGPACNCAIHATDDSKCACGKDLKAFPKDAKQAACAMSGQKTESAPCSSCSKCAKRAE